MFAKQCVILVGGLGTRLGPLTAAYPKPLLPVAKQPFLDTLLWHASRFGFENVLLLAGYQAEAVAAYARSTPYRHSLDIAVLTEPRPLGTAGALRAAAERLEEKFVLLNGDSVYDFNWLDLAVVPTHASETLAVMALRWLEDTSRCGVVTLEDAQVTGFHARGDAGPGLVNGGVYLMDRAIVGALPEIGSLEADVLPMLAAKGAVGGRLYNGFFLDIGVPDALQAAQTLVPGSLRRPAVFFDRDGVLNFDRGHVGTIARFEWIPGAREAVKLANDAGFFAFVITNQAGVARAFYDEAAVRSLHAHMQSELRAFGAHIDDFRYCPHHPEGGVPEYAITCSCRKPEPGMILDLLAHWPVEFDRSLFIGDQPTDIEAGNRAGLRTLQFESGDLHSFLVPMLAAREMTLS